MKSFWRVFLALVALMVLGALAALAVALSTGWRVGAAAPIGVRLLRVDRGPIEELIRVTGVASSPRQVSVAAQVSGQVSTVAAELGATVAQGAVLLRIDADQAQAQLHVQQALLRESDAEVARRQAALDGLRSDYQAGGEARDKVEDAQAQLQLERLRRDRADADLAVLRSRLRQYEVVAPVSGIVTVQSIRAGEYAQAGQPLLTITPADGLELLARVEPGDAALVRVGMPARASLDSAPDVVAAEHVLRIEPAVRKEGGSEFLGVWISLASGRLPLRPNQQADVRIVARTRDDALRVPVEALVTRGGTSRIWVLADGRLALQPVRIGAVGDRYAELIGGLQAGQAIVAADGQALHEGTAASAVSAPGP